MLKDDQVISCIAVFSKDPYSDAYEDEPVVRKFPDPDACIHFLFDKQNSNELIFFTPRQVFTFNITEDDLKEQHVMYRFKNTLREEPSYGYFNCDQSKLIVTSESDCLYVDLKMGKEVDLDELLQVSSIQNIINDNTHFYLFANKKEAKLGYYLFRMSIDNPEDNEALMNWPNKLDVSDSSL